LGAQFCFVEKKGDPPTIFPHTLGENHNCMKGYYGRKGEKGQHGAKEKGVILGEDSKVSWGGGDRRRERALISTNFGDKGKKGLQLITRGASPCQITPVPSRKGKRVPDALVWMWGLMHKRKRDVNASWQSNCPRGEGGYVGETSGSRGKKNTAHSTSLLGFWGGGGGGLYVPWEELPPKKSVVFLTRGKKMRKGMAPRREEVGRAGDVEGWGDSSFHLCSPPGGGDMGMGKGEGGGCRLFL